MHSVHAGKSYIRNARERKGMIRGAAVARAHFARTHTNRKSNKGKMLNRTHSHTKKGRVAGINKPSSSHIIYIYVCISAILFYFFFISIYIAMYINVIYIIYLTVFSGFNGGVEIAFYLLTKGRFSHGKKKQQQPQ